MGENYIKLIIVHNQIVRNIVSVSSEKHCICGSSFDETKTLMAFHKKLEFFQVP
jgi:hypothetical protein